MAREQNEDISRFLHHVSSDGTLVFRNNDSFREHRANDISVYFAYADVLSVRRYATPDSKGAFKGNREGLYRWTVNFSPKINFNF